MALAVMATLALAIGAATTAFGVATAVLWRPLPFADADRLVFVWENIESGRDAHASRVTGFRFAAWRESGAPFSSMASFGAAGFTLDTPGGAVSVRGVRVSAGYFDTLGIPAMIGRGFAAADEVPGRDKVVILSHAFWRERFGGGRDVIGTRIRLSGETYTVIGVMPDVVFPAWPVNPATVTLDQDARQLWVPIPRTTQLENSAGAHVFGVVARLAPGATGTQAAAMLGRRTDPSAPDRHPARVTAFREQFVRGARQPLLIVAAAALCVLLIACANLAALHVSAFEARRAEFSMRAAIGASVPRLVRQLAMEALLLALMGSAAGVAIARMALVRIPALLPPSVPFLTTAGLDLRIFAFAIAVTILASIILMAWPVLQLLTSSPAPRGTAMRPRTFVYRTLVVTQIAVSVGLVMIAGLLTQSLRSVRNQDPGFEMSNVLVAQLGLPMGPRSGPRAISAAEDRLLAAAAAVPGVRAVAAAYDHPLGANWSENPTVVGEAAAPEAQREAELRIVSRSYFDALGVDLVAGRAFNERDDLDARGAAVVNEAFARELTGRVLGRTLRTGTPRFLYGAVVPNEFEIVGVVRNERFRGLEQPAQPAFYVSTRQFPQSDFVMLARTSVDPVAIAGAVRKAVQSADRAVTFTGPTSLERILAEQLVARRVTTGVIGSFAGAALSLSALGLYGLLAVLVAGRTREIGVRLALGASPAVVARTVLRESIVNTLVGIGIGLVLALLAGRAVQGILVGVSGRDLPTLSIVAATLLAVSVAAAVAPAWRAAQIDPIVALRAD
jgi:putative ABC transport system permease protein